MTKAVMRVMFVLQLALVAILLCVTPTNALSDCQSTCWNNNMIAYDCQASVDHAEDSCMCSNGADGWCAFEECASWCDIVGDGGSLDSWMTCPGAVCNNVPRAVPTLHKPILPARDIFERTVTACTNACWLLAIEQSSCNNTKSEAETACMCNSEANYERFYDCDIECMFLGESEGLSPAQECIGFGADAPTAAAAALRVHEAATAVPTTFITAVKRAASPQIAALTPWKTSAPKAPKPAQSIPHVSFPATIGFCGVPGESCDGKFVVEDEDSSTESVPSVLTAREADPQIAALTPWKTSAPKAPKPAESIPHVSFPATIGFCGVPGESCDGKFEVDSDASAQMPVTSIVEVRDAAATFIPSLVRMCEEPDLVHCYIPLPPDPADINKRAALSTSSFIPPTPTPGELATYGGRPWPTTTASYEVDNCDPELEGVCAGAKRKAV